MSKMFSQSYSNLTLESTNVMKYHSRRCVLGTGTADLEVERWCGQTVFSHRSPESRQLSPAHSRRESQKDWKGKEGSRPVTGLEMARPHAKERRTSGPVLPASEGMSSSALQPQGLNFPTTWMRVEADSSLELPVESQSWRLDFSFAQPCAEQLSPPGTLAYRTVR